MSANKVINDKETVERLTKLAKDYENIYDEFGDLIGLSNPYVQVKLPTIRTLAALYEVSIETTELCTDDTKFTNYFVIIDDVKFTTQVEETL